MEINQRIQVAEKFASNVNSEFMPNPTIIKVIGVGNGGCNAINRMIEEGIDGVSFIAMNTDAQMLSTSKADIKVILGEDVTGGLGAGTDPEKGAEAARRDEKVIAEIIGEANLVFVASGFGGGTGTGASPIIANIAKASGALTIGVVTKPFEMEGTLKMNRAEKGIEQMSPCVDSLIIIPNENLNDMFEQDISFEDALKVVDDILRQAVQGISDIITQTGFGINVDFADVQTMIRNSNGRAHLGIGSGKGDKRLDNAALHAFNNPLLDIENIRNAKGILANILCPKDFGLREYKEAMKIIHTYADKNANIKIGVCQKEDMHDEVRVTIIATGFEYDNFDKNKSLNDDKLEQKTFSDNDIVKSVKEVAQSSNDDIRNNTDISQVEDKQESSAFMMNENRKNYSQNETIRQDVTTNNIEPQIAENNNCIDSMTEIKPDTNETANNVELDTRKRFLNIINNYQRLSDDEENMYSGKDEDRHYSMLPQEDFEGNVADIEEDESGYVNASTQTTMHNIKKDKFNFPYNVVSEDELSHHRKLGEIENSQVYDENDIDTPAFLRRPIEIRK